MTITITAFDRSPDGGKGLAREQERQPLIADRIRQRLQQLAARLGAAAWLDADFSAGDLTMISVLQRSRASGILDEFPSLAAYVARGEARPAYQRAFADQLAFNTRPA